MARGIKLQSVIPVALAVGLGVVGAWGFSNIDEGGTRLFASSSACNPNYSGRCLPLAGPDIDCSDVGGPVRVVGSDVYNLDEDGDGEGCEPFH